MEYIDLLLQRHSCRSFQKKPIPNTLLDQLIKESDFAPMSGNRKKDRQLIPISDPLKLHHMAEIVKKKWENALDPDNLFYLQLKKYGKNFIHFANAPTVIFLAARCAPDYFVDIFGECLADRFHGNSASVFQAAMLFMLSAENNGLATCMMTGPLVASHELGVEINLQPHWKLCGLISVGYKKN